MSFFKRFRESRQTHDLPGDVATGDWSPIPATGRKDETDWGSWLQEAETPPSPVEQTTAASTRPDDYLQYLSPEERAIVESQNSEVEVNSPARPRYISSPVPICKKRSLKATDPRQRAIGNCLTTLRALQKPDTAERNLVEKIQPLYEAPAPVATGNWTDVLQSPLGEHLTDEELLIIRGQLK